MPGVIWSKFFIAVTGQIGFDPRDGILRILTDFLSWSVFDHFIINWMPGGSKDDITSRQVI